MAWYATNTVSVTNNSATVTGSGTAFIANVSIGEGFIGPDGLIYEITNVVSDTSLTIKPNYRGSTASGQSYLIVPVRGRIADLIAEVQSLLASFATVRDGIGAGLFPDGSAATPAFRFSNDQDTGFYRFGDNAIGLTTGGTVRAVLNGSGNLAIGTTNPGDWRLNISRGSQGNLAQFTDGVESTFVIRTESGVLQCGQANNLPLAIVTNSIERMRIAANGNVGIGATSPTQKLDVSGAENAVQARFGAIAARGLSIGTEVVAGVTDAGSYLNALGAGSGTLILKTEGSERVRVTASGNVGIGTNDPGMLLQVANRGGFAGDGTFSWGQALTGNNRGFLSWNTDLASVNAIQSLVLGAGSGWTVRLESGGAFRPGGDNSQNIGSGSFRWGTVFAATGTINTSDEREKHWRGELSPAELRAAKRIIGELGIYQWNDAVAEKGEDGARLHFGVRAQRAFAIMEDEELDWQRYAWACYDQWEEQTEPVMEEVTVTKTRKVMRPSSLLDPATGQPAMVEVDEAYEETEMQPTGETRVTLEAGDRYGVRPDQLAFWLIAAQANIQEDLEARIAALEGV